MRKLLRRIICIKKVKHESENYYRAIPTQALKTWRHFDRFNVELYHDYLIKINEQ